jgi:hypothetical protein
MVFWNQGCQYFLVDVFAEYLSENKSNGSKTLGEFYSVAYNQNFRQHRFKIRCRKLAPDCSYVFDESIRFENL